VGVRFLTVSVTWDYIQENSTELVDLVQSGPHHHIIENYIFLTMIL